MPLVTGDTQDIIYNAIAQQFRELGCTLIAIGGVADYVHILIGYPLSLTVSELIRKFKPDSFFKWQGGYGACTRSNEDNFFLF